MPVLLDAIADDLEHLGEQYSDEYKKLYRYTYYVSDFYGIDKIASFTKHYYEKNFDNSIVWYNNYFFMDASSKCSSGFIS